MAHKGRLTKQVEDAIRLLKKEGTIIVPMNEEQYNASKDYKFQVMEQIHEVQKNVNWQVQMRLYEAIENELYGVDVDCIPNQGLIRLK